MSKLDEVFDIEPVKKEEFPIAVETTGGPLDDAMDNDAKFATRNIRNLIEIGNKALEEAFAVAIESESPRAYEVLSNLLKNVSDMNSQLMDIHGKKKTITGKAPDAPKTTVTNNSIFVGTTSDLIDKITERLTPK